MALIRPAFLAALVYACYIVAFPDYTGDVYHVMTCAVIAGGSVGLWCFNKVLDLGEGLLKIAAELVFLAAVALFIGYTLPQTSGRAPLAQWSAGARPTREQARRGLKRLGVDPHGTAASGILRLFPR